MVGARMEIELLAGHELVQPWSPATRRALSGSHDRPCRPRLEGNLGAVPVLQLNGRRVLCDNDAVALREAEVSSADAHIPGSIVEVRLAVLQDLRGRIARAHVMGDQ